MSTLSVKELSKSKSENIAPKFESKTFRSEQEGVHNPEEQLLPAYAERFISNMLVDAEVCVASKLRSALGFEFSNSVLVASRNKHEHQVNKKSFILNKLCKNATGQSIDSIVDNGCQTESQKDTLQADAIKDKMHVENMVADTLMQQLSHTSISETLEVALLQGYGVAREKIAKRINDKSKNLAIQTAEGTPCPMQALIRDMKTQGIFKLSESSQETCASSQKYNVCKLKLQNYLHALINRTLKESLRKSMKNSLEQIYPV